MDFPPPVGIKQKQSLPADKMFNILNKTNKVENISATQALASINIRTHKQSK
jgi:hypothetical protein